MLKTRFRRWFLVYIPIALLAVGLIGAFIPMRGGIYDGGCGKTEFQLTFKDETDRPLPGVVLRVEDRAGRVYYHYPVTDYLPDQTPTSDGNGRMVFHYTADLIFSEEIRHWGPFEVKNHSNYPEYVCRFLYRDVEIHRTRFSELVNSHAEAETVKRQWKEPSWPASELIMLPGKDEEECRKQIRAVFDLNQNGKLEPEEEAAFRAAMSGRSLNAGMVVLGAVPQVDEIEFPIIRKTITVRTPK